MEIDEHDRVAVEFGVATEQVERDHLISHLLAAISENFRDRLHFIGGTALARTHLVSGRLSEDIDSIALGSRAKLAVELDAALPRAVARSYGRLEWVPALGDVPAWPTELRTLEQRYSDVASAELFVPTLPAFVAGKTATWHDRRASRDLWDLWALNDIGAIDGTAGALYRRHGPTNRLPSSRLFDRAPDEEDWSAQLGAQTRLSVSAATALTAVRDAWARVSD